MDRPLVAAALAAAVSACRVSGVCDTGPFDVSGRVDGYVVDEALTAETAGEQCRIACERAASVWVVQMDHCELTVSEAYEPLPDTASYVRRRPGGTVSCRGVGEELCKGRHPPGLVGAVARGPDAGGRILARYARDERAAVVAFEQLAERLTAWGAPGALVARCLRAADDERLHDRLLSAQARARGVDVPAFQLPSDAPGRWELAVNNAVMGCANEAAAALIAHLLARSAPTPDLRAAFARIARDEAGHAQLSFDLHRWFRAQLDAADAVALERILDRALAGIPRLLVAEVRALRGLADLSVRDVERAGAVLAQGLG